MRRTLILCSWVVLTGAAPRVLFAQDVDTTLARIERLVVAGDRSTARVLADSLIGILPPESPHVAEVLYWRAQSASSAVDAERDYLRISIEHPFASRAPDALLALAQLEYARGDRRAARRRFDRLLRDYPRGKHVVRASLSSARLAIEDLDHPAGCATLAAARPLLGADDVELRNQFDYYTALCDRLPPPDTTAIATADQPAAAGPRFSVQVAAYSALVDAGSLAARLRARGYEVRVVGDRAPYRVRVGRYTTRSEAAAALARMRAAGLGGMVVEAEPR